MEENNAVIPRSDIPTYHPVPEKHYTMAETVLSVIAIVLGYLSLHTFFSGFGIGLALSLLGLCIAPFIYFNHSTVRMSGASYFWLAVTLLLTISVALYESKGIQYIKLFALVICGIFWIYTATAEKSVGKIRSAFFGDLLDALVVRPFSSFEIAPESIAYSIRKKGKSKSILYFIIGLAIAVPITFIVGALLMSADRTFASLFSSLFSNILDHFATFVWQFGFSIPLAFYLAGMWLSGTRDKKRNSDAIRDNHTRFCQKCRRLPGIAAFTALTPLCLLYVLFFFSQSGYYFSAFQNLLPEGFSYAEYARQGFFELCTVAMINFALLVALWLFIKRKDSKPSLLLRLYASFLSVATLLLIATALRKMILYIQSYGLTPRRIYCSSFMIMLAVVFLFILIRQWADRFPIIRCSVIALCLCTTALCFTNMDVQIARYNVQAYQQGNIKEMDFSVLYCLSYDTAAEVIPLLDDKDEQVRDLAQIYLKDARQQYAKKPLSTRTIYSYMAENKIMQSQ